MSSNENHLYPGRTKGPNFVIHGNGGSNDTFTNQQGQNNTDFIDCIAWRKLGETVRGQAAFVVAVVAMAEGTPVGCQAPFGTSRCGMGWPGAVSRKTKNPQSLAVSGFGVVGEHGLEPWTR